MKLKMTLALGVCSICIGTLYAEVAVPDDKRAGTGEKAPTTATAKTAEAAAPVTDCAGEWTRAVASINDPAHNNTMVIRNATSAQDARRRALKCRSDVGYVNYFEEGVRLACAPYIACSAQ
jgi:hypothetical protein